MLTGLLNSGRNRKMNLSPVENEGYTLTSERQSEVNLYGSGYGCKKSPERGKLDPGQRCWAITYMHILICLGKVLSRIAVDGTRKNREKSYRSKCSL